MSLATRPCKSVSSWCCKKTPIPTPTVTATPTVTQTSTPTLELTPTLTPTLTTTITSTLTPTPTVTQTNTPTLDLTPTPTLTETPTNTPTNTLTPTNTPTNTLTSTLEPTPSNTPTQTVTPTTLCCYQYEVTNYYATAKTVYYTDCNGTPSSISCAGNGLQTYINCALEGSLTTNDTICDNSSTDCITWNAANTPCGGCIPPSQTPTNTPTSTPTPTLTPTNTIAPTSTPTNTLTNTLTPTSTSTPILSCGNSYNGSYSPLTSSLQQVNLDLTSTPNGSTINLQFDAISRPNRFNIYDSVSGLIYTSGWIGSTSSVPGPWNPPGTTPANTNFTYDNTRTYYILVDIAADSISDSYTINLTCTPPPSPTPTPTSTQTPTVTPTLTLTNTATNTPTYTSSSTPTVTPTIPCECYYYDVITYEQDILRASGNTGPNEFRNGLVWVTYRNCDDNGFTDATFDNTASPYQNAICVNGLAQYNPPTIFIWQDNAQTTEILSFVQQGGCCTTPPTPTPTVTQSLTPTSSIAPTTTPTQTNTPTQVASYAFCLGYDTTDCGTACADYNNCLN